MIKYSKNLLSPALLLILSVNCNALGNILSVKEYAHSTGELEKEEKTIAYTYGNDGRNGWNNLLVGVDLDADDALSAEETITYDAIGNPTAYLGAQLTWNARQLEGYTNAENTISYTYDSDGLRASKTVNGAKTTYQYVDSALYYQCTYTPSGAIDNELYFFYDSYGNLASIRCFTQGNEYTYYTATNIQGDVLGIYDPQGNIVASYEYDTWGNLISTTDNSPINISQLNPVRYRGYYFDNETNLYYLQSRYYNPQVGRFLNADSVIDNRGVTTQNLFTYCGNNPIINTDSSGHLFGAILGIGILAVGMAVAFSGCSKSKTPTTTNAKRPSTSLKHSTTSKPPTTTSHIPTRQEKSYAATVYAEAGGQNRRTKQAVAHVMNNRIGTRSTWTDIEAVISAKYQFDGYNSLMYQSAMNYYNNGTCDNSIDKAAMDECLEVVIPIYSGDEADITGGALYFHSFPNASDWPYHNDYTQVFVQGTENFWFYK